MSSKNFMAYDDAVSVLREYASDIKGKIDKVASATADDFATLDSNGNLTDSGISKAVVPSGATSSNKLATANDIPTELNDLSDDVAISSPQDAQVLTYNGTSGKWENKAGGTSGVSSFNGRTGAVVPASGDYTKSDVGLGSVVNTGDSATPVSGGTTKFTTGGAYTELNKKADKVTGTFTSGDLVSLDANGNITDSGILATDVAIKAPNATNGHLANFNSNGDLSDSGIASADLVITRANPASGGTDLSLVTTGDMYTWNEKIGKSSTGGLIKNDGTIDTNSYATTTKAYLTDDTAETALADADYIPFYDTSATAKRKSTWSNIKSVLKTYFDTIYSTVKTLSGLTDTNITSPSQGQILEYDATNSKWVNAENIQDFARYGGSKLFSELTSSLLVAENVDKFYLCTDGGTISSADAGNWILPAGAVIPADSHIAVIEYSTGVYKFDDFGGYVDISGKADRTELDSWSTTATVSSGAVSFSGIDDTNNNAYDLYISVTSNSTNKNPTSTITSISGTGTSSMSIVFSTDADNGATAKLRVIK